MSVSSFNSFFSKLWRLFLHALYSKKENDWEVRKSWYCLRTAASRTAKYWSSELCLRRSDPKYNFAQHDLQLWNQCQHFYWEIKFLEICWKKLIEELKIYSVSSDLLIIRNFWHKIRPQIGWRSEIGYLQDFII